MVLISKSIISSCSMGVPANVSTAHLGFSSALMLLSQFKELMANDGATVDTLHMLADSTYAFEQLAQAHTSTSESLRHCAMRVFALFSA
jgi:hypothetical protein